MEQTITADLPGSAPAVYEVVSDLSTYPQWLDLVSKVEADGGEAWWVTLRAKLGPLARSKRLRMVRTTFAEPNRVRFERSELDGRDHARWVLDVRVAAASHDEDGVDRSTVTMDLRYDGGLWSRPLETALKRQVDDAVPRLAELIADR